MSRYRCGIELAMCIGALVIPIAAGQSQSEMQSRLEAGRTPAGKEWPLANGDWGNTRYSTLTQINTQTIKDLRGAWVSKKFEDGGMSRSTPVVKDGLMFVTAGIRVYALNAKTGQTVWSYLSNSRNVPGGSIPTALLSGYVMPNTQGVAVADGMVFVGLTDGRLVALSEKTGEPLWDHQVGDDPPKRGQTISTAPNYAQGVVLVGMANGDFGLRGRVVALDAKTGRELWHFSVIPGPGEVGHDTWPQNSESWKQGGGGVWNEGTVDPELGMVYFAPGNTYPQSAGEMREGDNLFTCSVVALDLKTGKLRWYYQFVHHDIWDSDGVAPTQLILYDSQVGGRPRKALAAMRSDGYLFMLDRQTGKPLIPVEERSVPQNPQQKTAATQPFPVGAQSVLPECSEWKGGVPAGFELGCTYSPSYSDKPYLLTPGFGMRVSPMSFSPQTGYFYAQGGTSLAARRRFAEDPWYFGPGGENCGSSSRSGKKFHCSDR